MGRPGSQGPASHETLGLRLVRWTCFKPLVYANAQHSLFSVPRMVYLPCPALCSPGTWGFIITKKMDLILNWKELSKPEINNYIYMLCLLCRWHFYLKSLLMTCCLWGANPCFVDLKFIYFGGLSLRTRTQNYKCKIRYKSEYLFRMGKEMIRLKICKFLQVDKYKHYLELSNLIKKDGSETQRCYPIYWDT